MLNHIHQRLSLHGRLSKMCHFPRLWSDFEPTAISLCHRDIFGLFLPFREIAGVLRKWRLKMVMCCFFSLMVCTKRSRSTLSLAVLRSAHHSTRKPHVKIGVCKGKRWLIMWNVDGGFHMQLGSPCGDTYQRSHTVDVWHRVVGFCSDSLSLV